MTLLEEIQRDAVDENAKLGPLIRKCKVFAARVGSAPLEAWLLHESDGYPDDIKVPDYRIWRLQLKGNFAGGFGSGLRNAQIPMVLIPKKVRQSYERYEFTDSVTSAEEALKAIQAGGKLYIATSDLWLRLGSKVYQGMNCMEAWADLNAVNLIALLNAVRNRILDLSLAVWKEKPNAGEVGQPNDPASAARITSQFTTIVHGGTVNVVGDARAVIGTQINTSDFAALSRLLLEHGVNGTDVNTLKEAIQVDGSPIGPEKFGGRVSAWMGTMIVKAATGTWDVGVAVAGPLLAAAVGAYYGWPH